MEDAPTLLKIPKSECPDFWLRLPKHKWPKSWDKFEVKKFQIGNAYSYTVKKDYSYLCMWTISNCLERNKTLIRHGKSLMKDVDIGRTNIIPRPCLFELHSKRMPDLQGYC